MGAHSLRGNAAFELVPNRLFLEGSADYDIRNDTLWQMRAQARYQAQCCGLLVEYIRYNWNGRDEKQWRFNLELENIGVDRQLPRRRPRLGVLPVRLLVTGAGGFVGGHLLELVRREAPATRVFGVVQPHGSSRVAAPGARVLEADLDDPQAASAVIDEVRPDAIVHLAGQSSVHQSWLDPGGTLRTNVLGIVHLLDAARRRGARPRGAGRRQRRGVRRGARERAADPGRRRRSSPPRPTR